MAVYTKLDKKDFNKLFSEYNLGKVLNFRGIKQGIENTNYVVNTQRKKVVLTVYEKRVKKKDLPFFLNLMKSLCKSNFLCPEPIKNKKKKYISNIFNKKVAIVTFLEGEMKNNLSLKNCYDIGREAAKLHKFSKKISLKRKNNLSVDHWPKLFSKVKNKCSKIHKDLPGIINKSLEEIKKNWPKKLPSGIIHSDLFVDNIFFKNDRVSGIIDFYFACNDFYAFEIAVCINALCFEGSKENLSFNATKAKKFIDGYCSIRKLNNDEKKSLKVLSQGAAMRFLLTRVFDYLNLQKGAIVTVKDPIEYLKRLEFHNSVKSFKDYCI